MADDTPLTAFARRHGLTPTAVRELETLVGQSTGDDDPSRTRPPEPSRGSDPAAVTLDAPGAPRYDLAALDLDTDRYEVLGRLGRGGQGEVFRVFDHKMERALAMKVLRPLASAVARARFRTETALTVGLEHPGIVPIYDRGLTADGRPWYTMQILEGADFGHIVSDPAQPLRRRVDIFVRACEAVAYAHRQGVVHRDLKPQNIMIGAFGEVRVLDWGLARRLHDRPDGHEAPRQPETDPFATRLGAVMGTPRYMAPEQLAGQNDAIGPPTDVYALGLILAELLTGAPPAGGDLAALRAARAEDGPAPTTGPPALCALCARMTRHAPERRPADAGEVAEAVRTWLDGARRREQAAALVAEAAAIEPSIARLRAEAETLDRQAAEILDALPAHAPVDDKRAGWALSDEAVARRRDARLAEVKLRQTLQSALRLDPDSTSARDALTAHYRARLLEAEALHDDDRAAEYRALLEGHDPAGNVEWLRGDGRLTLFTDPPGATVELRRYVAEDRRLVDVPVRTLAQTPLVDLPLAMGSYLLVLRAPGRADVRYPVHIGRHGIWDGIPPGESMPYAIPMPSVDTIGPDDCYVPAGWCLIGGDPQSVDSLPPRRLWIDGFVIARHPVTHDDVIGWLDGLIAAGRVDEAERFAPVQTSQGDVRPPVYARHPDKRFALGPAFGTQPEPDWPAVGLTWAAARAFVATRGAGARLPMSWEWEKAARGVDGRHFPWGDHFACNWANVMHSRAGPPRMCAVGDHPLDVSPYGVLGLAGNVRDLCGDVYRRRGPVIADGRPVPATEPGEAGFLVVKGGNYASEESACRAAGRFGLPTGQVSSMVGLRVCRPLTASGRSRSCC